LVEIVESVLAASGPFLSEALSEATPLVQASGNSLVWGKFQEFVKAVAKGEGGTQFLELATLVQSSGDPTLRATVANSLDALVETEPPEEQFEEFLKLVEASGNEQIREAFFRLDGPSPELLQEVETKISAIGDQSLQARFQVAVGSGGEEFDAFLQGFLFDALKDTLK
jgi:hypothetical protein